MGLTIEIRDRCRKAGLCTQCGSQLASRGAPTCSYCRKVATRHKRRSQPIYRKAQKIKTLAAYGGCCAVCGITDPDVLQIDHVHNDGYTDRKEGRDTKCIYFKVSRESYPDRYQVLCANCNWKKKMVGGVTPTEVSWGPLTSGSEVPKIE